jgi:hypothetical protein
VDAISLENIDTLTEWRVEFERPIMEEAPSWLEVEEEQPEHVHGAREDLDDPPLLGGRSWSSRRTLGLRRLMRQPHHQPIHKFILRHPPVVIKLMLQGLLVADKPLPFPIKGEEGMIASC